MQSAFLLVNANRQIRSYGSSVHIVCDCAWSATDRHTRLRCSEIFLNATEPITFTDSDFHYEMEISDRCFCHCVRFGIYFVVCELNKGENVPWFFCYEFVTHITLNYFIRKSCLNSFYMLYLCLWICAGDICVGNLGNN